MAVKDEAINEAHRLIRLLELRPLRYHTGETIALVRRPSGKLSWSHTQRGTIIGVYTKGVTCAQLARDIEGLLGESQQQP